MRAVCLSGVLYEYMYGVLYRRLQLLGRRGQETRNGTNAGSSRREEAVTSVRHVGTEKERLIDCVHCPDSRLQREFPFLAPLEHLRRPAITIAGSQQAKEAGVRE